MMTLLMILVLGPLALGLLLAAPVLIFYVLKFLFFFCIAMYGLMQPTRPQDPSADPQAHS